MRAGKTASSTPSCTTGRVSTARCRWRADPSCNGSRHRRWGAGPTGSSPGSRRLLRGQQLDVEHQARIRRDGGAGTDRTVTEAGRDVDRALAAHLHAGDALLEARDQVVLAQRDGGQGAGVELRAMEVGRLVVVQ